MRVVLKDEVKQRDGVQGWLRAGREYVVLSLVSRNGQRVYRIEAENGTPALFEAELFSLIDDAEDSNWRVTSPASGMRVWQPEEWCEVGFWEKYFDGDPESVRRYQIVARRMIEGPSPTKVPEP